MCVKQSNLKHLKKKKTRDPTYYIQGVLSDAELQNDSVFAGCGVDRWIIPREGVSGMVSNFYIVESMSLSVGHVGLREIEFHDQFLREPSLVYLILPKIQRKTSSGCRSTVGSK